MIVTSNQLIWVNGDEPNYVPPDWDGPRKTGWTLTSWLDNGMLVLLANGELGQISLVNPIWRTFTEGVGWMDLGRDSCPPRETGHLIDLRGKTINERFRDYVLSEFLNQGGFLDRYDDEEIADEWAFKITLYNLEIEGSHACYVGELGIG